MSHKEAIELNNKAFNAMVNDYDTKIQKSGLTKIIPNFIRLQNVPLNGKLLDFGCGTGIMLESLVENFDQVVGIDVNENFLKIFQNRYPSSKTYNLDILEDPIDNLGKFDIIVCTLAYHHFDDCFLITQKLSSLLNSGGQLIIVDIYNPEIEIESVNRIEGSVRHLGGLKRQSLIDSLSRSGLQPNIKFLKNQQIWQQDKFIRGHATKSNVDKLNNNELEKIEENGLTLFKFDIDLVMAIGKKSLH